MILKDKYKRKLKIVIKGILLSPILIPAVAVGVVVLVIYVVGIKIYRP